eukprot:6057035-Amphidinium_carterae.1
MQTPLGPKYALMCTMRVRRKRLLLIIESSCHVSHTPSLQYAPSTSPCEPSWCRMRIAAKRGFAAQKHLIAGGLLCHWFLGIGNRIAMTTASERPTPQLRQLQVGKLQVSRAPAARPFAPKEILGSLWNHASFKTDMEKVRVGKSKAPLVHDLQQESEGLSVIDIKAELLLFFHTQDEEAIVQLLQKVQSREVLKVEALGVKVPAQRKEELMAEASSVVEGGLARLRDLRKQHIQDASVLSFIPALVACQRGCSSVEPSGEIAGLQQEQVALEWAQAQWAGPNHEILAGYSTQAQAGAG